MQLEIVTKDDLQMFRQQLLEDIQRLLQPTQVPKKWLRSREVRKLLQISAGTLQNLRINNSLHPVRLAGSKIWFYDADEIEALLHQKTKHVHT